MTVADLDTIDVTPVLVQSATSLPASDDGWVEVPRARATKVRAGSGNDLSSAELEMEWGVIHDPNDYRTDGLDIPTPPLAVDDLVRLMLTTITDGQAVPSSALWHGVVESIDWSDPKRATVKAVDLGVCLAKAYTSRGWEVASDPTAMVDPGYLPAFNAIPGGDRKAVARSDGVYIHDRSGAGTAVAWTAFQIAGLLLAYALKEDLPGAPAGLSVITWRLDPASSGDYTPDTLDLHGLTIAECMERLFGGRRGLAWRVTVSGSNAQVLVLDLNATGAPLDTTGDLGWTDPKIQDRRDGFDYILVSGARPLVGITLWWTRGTGGSIEPDGWDPATADTALDAALQDELGGKAYDRPEWRRFRLKRTWDGSQYDGSSSGSGTIGLRNSLVDNVTYAPPEGTRWFRPPSPPPAALTIERQVPAGQGFIASLLGPKQQPIVIAGATGRWEDLSKECTPTPIGGAAPGERNDQGTCIIHLGETAEDADRLRQAVSTTGTVLVTIGIREWAPLQCAWAAPTADWSKLSPRIYHLRRPGIEEWLCLAGCVKGLTTLGALDVLATQVDARSDVAKLVKIRDQLAVRFGRAITAAAITRQGEILTTRLPGVVLSDLTLVDGRAYPVDMPLAEVTWDLVRWTTTLRWAPPIKETPSA